MENYKIQVFKKKIIPYLLISPAQLLLFLFMFLPILYTLWLSFFSYTFGKEMSFIGFDNYIEIFKDKYFIKALVRNIIFVSIVVYVELFAGLGMALFFTGWVPMKRIMISVVMGPYAVSEVLGVLVWRFILEPDIGMLNKLLLDLNLPQFLWTIIPGHAFIMILFIGIWLQIPFTFLILYNAIISIPNELFEAARVDGASSLQIFSKITVPIIMPAIIICLMFRYIFAFRTFGEVWILSKGGPFRSTELLSVYLYKHGFEYFEFGIASAVAWVMIIITILIAAYYLRIMYKRMFANDSE